MNQDRPSAPHTRRIEVPPDWLDQLEGFLQADERAVAKEDPAFALVLLTPWGKTLVFASSTVIEST
jgi:hypothetical protein